MLSQNIDISDNDNYYNRIHVYDFTDSITTPPYDTFFKNDGTEQDPVPDYDIYLMRDNENKCYVVFISKKTINEKFNKTLSKTLTIKGYTLKHFRSDNIFLINKH